LRISSLRTSDGSRERQTKKVNNQNHNTMNNTTNKTWLRAACLGIAIPLAASAGTLASGFDNGWNHDGVLPWGARQDHGSEYYQSWNGQWGGNYLTLHSYPNTGGHTYESGTAYCNTQVPASGYDSVTVSCDIQNPYVGVQGCWPAFWLDTTKSWPPEIDIAEFKGNQGGRVWQNVCNDYQQWQVAQNWVDGNWHNYSVVMGPANGGNRSYQLYLDGSNKMQGSYHDGQNSPFWVICNLAMEGDSGRPGPNYNTYVSYHNFSITTSGSGGGGGGGGSYKSLVNHQTGLLIDGMGRNWNGADCGQYGNSGSANQKWDLSNNQIKNQGTGLYLDGMGRSGNGSVCGQWSNSGSNAQKWTQENTGGYIKFRNNQTGLYLDGMGYTGNGSALCQWSGSGSWNQQFSIQ
jgi:hypothetical protein